MMEDKVIFERSTIKGLADAIRLKRGITNELLGSQLEAEVLSIENFKLPELTNPAKAEEVVLGKEFINGNGEVEVGTLEIYEDEKPNKLALLAGVQNATTNPYEITAEDLEGATELGIYAFYQKSGLTRVSLPTTCTKIGTNALRECDGLTSVNMPSVISIGNGAFYQCPALTSADAPNATTIGSNAFYQCFALTLLNAPNATMIDEKAFQNCSVLTSVNISSVISIRNSAFYYCYALTSLTIPSSCKTIGNRALQCGYSNNKCTFIFEGTTPPTISTNTFDTTKLEKIIVPKGCGETYRTTTNWVNFADYIEEAGGEVSNITISDIEQKSVSEFQKLTVKEIESL